MQDKISAEDIARMHQEDLKIEHLYNCRGLTYWCDEVRRTAFCLIEAPNAQAIHDMHSHSHGSMAHSVIEVEPSIVESFLGRIIDPKKEKGATLNIIDEPAYRFIALIKFKLKGEKLKISYKINDETISTIKELVSISKGRIVKKHSNHLLVSFENVSHAVMALLAVQKYFNKQSTSNITLSIGLSSGSPIEQHEHKLFENTVKQCQRFCNLIPHDFVTSATIKELFNSENNIIDASLLNESNNFSLSKTQELFLATCVDNLEQNYNNTEFKVLDFAIKSGLSKATLNRRLNDLIKQSPNSFIRTFRLAKSLELIYATDLSISEIAYKCGFNTSSFFTKKFKEYYKISPSSIRIKE